MTEMEAANGTPSAQWEAIEDTWDADHKKSPDYVPSKAEIREYNDRYARNAGHIVQNEEDLAWIRQVGIDATVFGDAYARQSVNRTLFVTKGGRLGLGPEGGMKHDDDVVLVDGGRMVFVVREIQSLFKNAEKKYRLMGECFVEGVMRGEVLERFGEREVPWIPLMLV